MFVQNSFMTNRIQEILDEKGLDAGWLSREIEIDYVTVYRWCKQIHQPETESLLKVAKKLNTTVNKLVVIE